MPSHSLSPAAGIVGLIAAGTYLVLALGQSPVFRVDRTGAAIIGAVLVVVIGGLQLEQAWAAVDYRTLILLFGMMTLIANLRLAVFFRTTARAIVVRVRHPAALLVAVVFTSGILSALFVNDTICLIFTPILIEVALARSQSPVPFLLALATASNIGSTATITGNPQNMLIGSVSGIGYVPFTRALGPVALAGLAIDAVVIYAVFRHQLGGKAARPGGRGPRPVHRAMMAKGLTVAGAMLAGFVAGLDTALVAASGAAVLLLTRRVKPEKIYRQIDWGLLVMFIGLFVVTRALEQTGLGRLFFSLLEPVGVDTVAGLSVVSTLLSNLVSNVPAVMLFAKVVPQLSDPTGSWLALAMSSTLAGNLTLLGSIANLIVVEGAARRGIRISFLDYLKVGLPVTLLTTAFGIWWLS